MLFGCVVHFVDVIRDPCDVWAMPSDGDDEAEEEEGERGAVASRLHKTKARKGVKVDIDLGLSAYANATRY